MKLLRIFLLLSLLGVTPTQSSVVQVVPDQSENSQDLLKAVDLKPLPVWEINRATIEAQKVAIHKYLKDNAKMRVIVRAAILTGAAVGLGYYLYCKNLPLPALSPDKMPVPVSPGVVAAFAENQGAMAKELKVLSEKLDLLSGKPLPKPPVVAEPGYLGAVAQKGKDVVSGTYSMAKEFGLFMIQSIPTAISMGFVNMLIFRDIPTVAEAAKKYVVMPLRRLNHPINLEWFLVAQMKFKKIRWKEQCPDGSEMDKERVDSEPLFKNLSRTAYVLPLASDEFERGHYVKTMVDDLNFVMRKLARTLAFCEIRTEQVSVNNKTCGKHLKEATAFVYSLTKKFGKEMAQVLASQELHAKIPGIISEFRFKLDDEFKTFRMYESAAFYDIIPR